MNEKKRLVVVVREYGRFMDKIRVRQQFISSYIPSVRNSMFILVRTYTFNIDYL